VTLSGVSHRGTICRGLSRLHLRSFTPKCLRKSYPGFSPLTLRAGKPSRLILLILTGEGDAGEMFSRKEAIDQVLEAANFTELIAALNAPVK
jgi:hypothetical protein